MDARRGGAAMSAEELAKRYREAAARLGPWYPRDTLCGGGSGGIIGRTYGAGAFLDRHAARVVVGPGGLVAGLGPAL